MKTKKKKKRLSKSKQKRNKLRLELWLLQNISLYTKECEQDCPMTRVGIEDETFEYSKGQRNGMEDLKKADLRKLAGRLHVKVEGTDDFSFPHLVDCHTNIDENETIPNTGCKIENKLDGQVQASSNHPKIQPKKKTTFESSHSNSLK